MAGQLDRTIVIVVLITRVLGEYGATHGLLPMTRLHVPMVTAPAMAVVFAIPLRASICAHRADLLGLEVPGADGRSPLNADRDGARPSPISKRSTRT
jgi:hypothetical protein